MPKLVFISHSSADKPIADAICHNLESRGIRCWIAPRDITTTDWAGSIMDGLHRSDVFVVIISHNSIPSPEVTKEVTEATRTCRYLLPFKVDGEVLSDRLRYHLGPCHWLDAVTPPLEKRIEELVHRIMNLSEEDAVYLNTERWKLNEHIVFPQGLFVGREKEIQEIADGLAREHVLFLQGMGGIGKSEIAKSYAKRYRERYDTIIFASYTSNLMDLICGEGVSIENLKRADGEEQESWFRRKMNALQTLVNGRTLLIIDNFDTDEDNYLVDILNLPCHLLFTTRNDHSDYPTIRIGKIQDFAQVQKIFTTHYGRPVKPEEQMLIDEMLHLVGCHTITVELIAKQMKASFLKPEKMLARLKETGVNTHLKEKVKREGAEDKLTSFDYIRNLFTFSGITEEEQHLLSCMCMVPVNGISVQLLGEILEMEDFDAVNGLIGKSWLMLDEEEDILRLHPVISDVVSEELKPTPLSCRDYVYGLWNRIKNCWFFERSERDYLYPYVSYYLNHYPDPIPELFTQYCAFVNIPWICSDFKQAVITGHNVYQFALKEYGSGTEETATTALYLAGAYLNGGDKEAAEPWYKKSLEHYLAVKGPVTAKRAQCYFKVGRCERERGNLEEAEHYYEKALAVYQEIIEQNNIPAGKKYPDQYEDLFVEWERLRMAEGRYEEALEMSRKSYELLLDSLNGESASSYYAILDMGICHSMLGHYEEAEKYLNRALELNLEYHGQASVPTVRTRESIADNALRSGDTERAKQLYSELELDLEKDFGVDNPQTIRIKGKYEAVKPVS